MRERDGRYKVLEVCGPVWGGREVVVVVVAVVVAEGQSKQVVVVDWGAAGEDGCGHLVDESKEERAGRGWSRRGHARLGVGCAGRLGGSACGGQAVAGGERCGGRGRSRSPTRSALVLLLRSTTTIMTDADQEPHLSILRIKRKRTDQPTPLDALGPSSPSLSRLLIFRCLTHPPRTSLQSSSMPSHPRPSAARTTPPPPLQNPPPSPREVRSLSLSPPPRHLSTSSHRPPYCATGIFRFAETVPLDSFSTPTKTRSLRDRIQSFLAHPPPALSRQHSTASLRSLARDENREASPAAARKAAPESPARRKLPSALRAAREAAAAGSSSAPPSPLGPSAALASTPASFGLSTSSSSSRPAATAAQAQAPPAPPSRAGAAHASRAALRYRIVERRRAESYAASSARAREADEVRRGLRPPTVRDSREVEREREEAREGERERSAGLRVYEAEAVREAGGAAAGAREGKGGRRRTAHKVDRAPRVEDDGDGEAAMDRFGEMLDEYLSRASFFLSLLLSLRTRTSR